ncbi:ABC transporter permease [Mycoplasma suis]|uniref:ABC transporter permease n=1 Tax=Mycoplasma suis TaxID=57372 RepID=UPI001E387119|nr:phosphate ABC transporter permease [Mycoplasma suis]
MFISIFLTHFTSIRLAKYVCRMRSEVKKIIILSLKILSVIPSFVTAFVLSEAITPVFFGINGVIAGARVAVLFIILTFFCTALPIFFLNYINWFESSEMKTLNSNLLSLGLNAKWREKLYSKASRRVIFLSWAVTLVKALGESVALSFFCSSSNFTKPFSGLGHFLSSNSHTISSMISSFYFAESGGEANRQAMFVYGAPLVLIAFLLNYFLIKKSVSTKHKRNWVERYFSRIKNNLNSCVERKKFKKPVLYYYRYISLCFHSENWIKKESSKEKLRKWKENIISFLILSIFAAIILTILIRGKYFIFGNILKGYLKSYSAEGLGVPLWNTILLLFFAVTWSLPVCFFSALFASAYLYRWRRLKYILSSFISGCGTVPPMLWAMFSMFLFIDQMKLSMGRVSIFAGVMSLFILNLPFLFSKFFNLFENYLKKYSNTFLSLGLHPYNIMFLVIQDGIKRMKLSVSDSITRLNGESGLLFLTAGASKSNRLTWWGHGQTLTTKIFASKLKYNILEAKSVMYESLVLLVFVSLFIFSIFNGMWAGVLTFLKKFFKKIYYRLYLKSCSGGIFSLSNLLSNFS